EVEDGEAPAGADHGAVGGRLVHRVAVDALKRMRIEMPYDDATLGYTLRIAWGSEAPVHLIVMAVRPRPVEADRQPRGGDRRHAGTLHIALRLAAALVSPLVIVLCAAAATGVLYRLRHAGVLA